MGRLESDVEHLAGDLRALAKLINGKFRGMYWAFGIACTLLAAIAAGIGITGLYIIRTMLKVHGADIVP